LLCGCPAIISDQTPWNDLKQNEAGLAIELTNQMAFKEAILFYADLNQEQFNQATNKAHQYISSKINIKQTIELYKKLFNDCIKN
jgi:glycosyltransferase involved in cell wall biosynthesis